MTDGRMVTAEEIAAVTERRADERAEFGRRFAVEALMVGGRFTRDAAESWLRAIEDAVRRDCARRCEAVREALRKEDVYYSRVAPIAPSLSPSGGPRPRETFTAPTIYCGPAAGADACACAIRDSIERSR